MSFALLVLQQEPEGFDIGDFVRIAVLALFFFGPALKSILTKKSEAAKPKRRVILRPQAAEEARQPIAPIETPQVMTEVDEDWGFESDPVYDESQSIEPTGPVWDTPPTESHLGSSLPSESVSGRAELDQPDAKPRRISPAWRSALVLREVLGPPVGLRSQNSDRAPFG